MINIPAVIPDIFTHQRKSTYCYSALLFCSLSTFVLSHLSVSVLLLQLIEMGGEVKR